MNKKDLNIIIGGLICSSNKVVKTIKKYPKYLRKICKDNSDYQYELKIFSYQYFKFVTDLRNAYFRDNDYLRLIIDFDSKFGDNNFNFNTIFQGFYNTILRNVRIMEDNGFDVTRINQIVCKMFDLITIKLVDEE